MEGRNDKCLVFKIVFAVIGTISGVSIFLSFLISFKNVNAAIWGLLSAVFAFIVLSLHVGHRRNVLLQRISLLTLMRLKYFGVFASFVTIVSSITYFILAVKLQQGYQLENDGYMPAAIFSLLTLKWTAFLYFQSKKYVKIYTADEEAKPIAKELGNNQ